MSDQVAKAQHAWDEEERFDDVEPISPVQIEQSIRQVATAIAKAVRSSSRAYKEFLDADHAFDLAFARAYMAFEGPAHARKEQATIDTEVQRTSRDLADATYRFYDRRAKALENQLRALQSIGASTRQAYGVAGRGEY
ncbi:hypothetical protein SEA_OBLADI_104 [Gordonia phage ObLaDi]|uniref:Uncharacterized protein n=3 Tax=Cafassovirus TaxID=3425056 RepID=A0A9E7TVI0_9CAUD|nr:hypothetical protein SEA_ALEEMILY_103 [Gordonia phage Aleemily]UXE03827.1 hypothetical protein SEA_OBLADI_104 [Gordonia phage ObLaDi]